MGMAVGEVRGNKIDHLYPRELHLVSRFRWDEMSGDEKGAVQPQVSPLTPKLLQAPLTPHHCQRAWGVPEHQGFPTFCTGK
ncbi:hypothetical protein Y1Q_0006211 [Alligator mississippiensis]|uniref:Uncharacterized protein n=1 Tax=Alligator mississippiensis TaxID=8496 RepID=A0A151NWV3_ALLMI|nr:hypothetical protein Y1Q_0006211 [Alligator mississippiensis]